MVVHTLSAPPVLQLTKNTYRTSRNICTFLTISLSICIWFLKLVRYMYTFSTSLSKIKCRWIGSRLSKMYKCFLKFCKCFLSTGELVGLTKYVPPLPYDVPSSLQRPEKVKSKRTKKICFLTSQIQLCIDILTFSKYQTRF